MARLKSTRRKVQEICGSGSPHNLEQAGYVVVRRQLIEALVAEMAEFDTPDTSGEILPHVAAAGAALQPKK